VDDGALALMPTIPHMGAIPFELIASLNAKLSRGRSVRSPGGRLPDRFAPPDAACFSLLNQRSSAWHGSCRDSSEPPRVLVMIPDTSARTPSSLRRPAAPAAAASRGWGGGRRAGRDRGADLRLAGQRALGRCLAPAHRRSHPRHAGSRRLGQRPRGRRRQSHSVRARRQHRDPQDPCRRRGEERRPARRARLAGPEQPAGARAIHAGPAGGRGRPPAHPGAKAEADRPPRRRRGEVARLGAARILQRTEADTKPARSPKSTCCARRTP